MTTPLLKFLALVLGFAMWGALGYFGKVPLDPLIALLQMGLGGLITHMLQADAPMPSAPLPAAAPPAQAGFARVSMMIFIAATAGAALMLAGCASLTEAGNVAYTVEPVADQNGKLVCCRFSAHDGKEFSGRNITFQKGDDGGIALQVQEGASSAFQGQAIAEKGLSVLPSFAPVLLPQGPAAK